MLLSDFQVKFFNEVRVTRIKTDSSANHMLLSIFIYHLIDPIPDIPVPSILIFCSTSIYVHDELRKEVLTNLHVKARRGILNLP